MSQVNRQKTPRDGKQKLLHAAAILFAQGSFNNVSVAQVLEISNVKAPSLYHHFGDKEGLYVAWATTTLQDLGKSLHNAKSLDELVSNLLNGARLDYLQLLRDLRELRSENAQQEIQNAIVQNLLKPTEHVIQLESNTTETSRLRESASLLLHMTMYAHPIYSSQRQGTRINGYSIKLIIDLVKLTARQ